VYSFSHLVDEPDDRRLPRPLTNKEELMSAPLLCPRCGSDEVMPRVRIVERGDDGMRHEVQAEVLRRPNARLFKRPERVNLTARVCSACGYAELYAESPGALYRAQLEADADPSISAGEELERTREALADSQIRLGELEQKLAFLEQVIERKQPPAALPPARPDGDA
jgi:predicted nucleic-acid-binding Zn-ribbon protein